MSEETEKIKNEEDDCPKENENTDVSNVDDGGFYLWKTTITFCVILLVLTIMFIVAVSCGWSF